MLSIYSSLLNRIYAHGGKMKTHVVLHSSCVLDGEMDKLFSDSLISNFYTFYMFEDSRYEALLLRKSKIGSISRNAHLLTANTEVFEGINLRDCYGKKRTVYKIIDMFSPSAENRTVFAFCDPSAAEEFVTNVVPGVREKFEAVNNNIDYSGYEHLSILCFNYFGGALDIGSSYTSPLKLKYFSAGNFDLWHMREKPQIINTVDTNGFSTEMSQFFYINGNKIACVSRKSLKRIYQGSFAEIYEIDGVDELKGKLIKILKNPPSDENFARYISGLSRFRRIFGDRIAFPEAAVYDEKSRFCGFMMSKADCFQLNDLPDYVGFRDFDSDRIESHLLECGRYASEIALLLLEMRLFGLSMTDISGRNICFRKKDNSVFLVDADSIEFQGFIFGEWFCTPGYSCENISRCGKREYYFLANFMEFSLSVLLFRLYFRSNPLVNNGADFDTDYEDWKQALQSPFKINKISSDSAYLARLPEKVWCKSFSDEQRRAFIKSFNDEKIYTIGQWIKILDLISE